MWLSVNKKSSSSYNPIYPRQTCLYFIRGKLSLCLECISNETNILKFLRTCTWRNKISRGDYRVGPQNYFYEKEQHLSFLFKILIYHLLNRSWNVVFSFYLTECLAWRWTERRIKTLNTLGRNLLLLIRDKGSFGSLCRCADTVSCVHQPSSCSLPSLWAAHHAGEGAGRMRPARSHKSEGLSLEALVLPGNCLTSSSFICSQEDFRRILLTNVSLYANGFKEKWRTPHN